MSVHKRRVRYAPNGCSAEITDVRADGVTARTFAVEAEDADAVVGVVRSLRLGNYVNTAYPVGLARIIDGVPERYAVIDCGTNSIKFHVAERTAAGGWRMLVDRAELTRLGEGLIEGGPIGRDAAGADHRPRSPGMAEEARAHDVIALAAVGTAGLRMASNRDDVRAEVARRTGVEVEVIPGDEESRLAFLAVRAGLADPGRDRGGARHRGRQHAADVRPRATVDEQWSVNVGAVRYTEAFGLDDAVSPEVLAEGAGRHLDGPRPARRPCPG